jgi:cytochrome c peroxidase
MVSGLRFPCVAFLALATSLALQDADGRDARVLAGLVDLTTAEVDAVLGLSPLPEPPPDPTNAVHASAAAARLGRALFFEERLSATGAVSCATCHDPEQSWTDGKPLGEGIDTVERNTMSLWNVAHNRWFFWDGRRDSLWSQALAPLEDPREHGFSRLELAHFLANEPAYRRAYEKVFGPLPDLSDGERFPAAGRPVAGDRDHPDALAWWGMKIRDRVEVDRVFANAGKAIAAFERLLLSREAPFDRFVEGLREGDAEKQAALSDAARRGLKLFVGKARCHLCHSGPNFTDLEFHDTRVPDPRQEGLPEMGRYRGIELVQADPFNGIGRYSDDPGGEAAAKISFLVRDSHNVSEHKTPSLRNVRHTAPYMRQGQLETLEEVLEFYSTLAGAVPKKTVEKLLVPVNLTEDEKADVIAFLDTLTDLELPEELTRAPATPYSQE